MRNEHEQSREGMHTHIHHIHGHWTQDPRFWEAIVLVIVIGLMIAAAIFTNAANVSSGTPYPPYLP